MNFLNLLWKKWLKVGHVIGNFQAQVFLTLFYFVFIWPFGIVMRLFADPLKLNYSKTGAKTNFGQWKHKKDTLEVAHRQF